MLQLLLPLAAPSIVLVQERDEFAKLSPFEAVRWQDARPEIQVGGDWYGLLSIDGVAADAVLAFAQETWPDKWVKRFEEDLVELMTRMGHAPGSKARLQLVDLANARERTLEDVAWTEANRQAIWFRAKESARPDALVSENVERVSRAHAARPARAYAELARWLPFAGGRSMTRAELEADLDQLEWLVEHQFAYRDLAGVDWRAAFDAARLGARDGASRDAFAVELAQLLAFFGDGHTRVRGRAEWTPGGFLPALLVESGEHVVVLDPDSGRLLEDAHPVLAGLDGLPIEDWLAAASRLAPRGSPQHERRASLEWLASIDLVRLLLGRKTAGSVVLDLRDAEGRAKTRRELVLASAPATAVERFTTEARLLEDAVGYLRIAKMEEDDAFLDDLDAAMQTLRDTRGLVIDVRGNGGGSRAALRCLLPYFLRRDQGPVVVNAAAPRVEGGIDAELPEDLLADRGLYRADAGRWTDEQRAFLARWSSTFRPEWTPDPALFGSLHFALVSPNDNPRAYHYEHPVVLLQDGGCFSATDVFLGAFDELEVATLVGTPTGGGSGRPRGAVLAHSGLEILLSSMASFRPSGRLYDRTGIEPDVRVEPTVSDRRAGIDAALERACAIVRDAR